MSSKAAIEKGRIRHLGSQRNWENYKDLVIVLLQRDLKVRYKNKFLGYLWSIANPLTSALIYYVAFSLIMQVHEQNYALLLVSALFPWQWFANSVGSAPNLFIGSGSIIKKISFPRTIVPFCAILNHLIHFIVSIPVIVLFLLIGGQFPSWSWLYGVPILSIIQFCMVYGISLALCSINLFFRDLDRLTGIVTHFSLLFTPILYTVERYPAEYRDLLVAINPAAGLMVNWRQLFLEGTINPLYLLISLGYAVLSLIIGYFIFSPPFLEVRRIDMKEPVISFQNVSKAYPLNRNVGGIKNFLFNLSANLKVMKDKRFEALRDINFEVHSGEKFGIIGRNGAGKSTTLGLVAGVLKPDRGTVTVRGRISPLLALGAGFHPELDGRENIVLNGVLMGLTRREVWQRMDEIVEFSELGEFIDRPVRVYSSGMMARLGFSVVAHLEPEILLIDEVLGVGDLRQQKCMQKMMSFKESGTTMVIVTHSVASVVNICDRVMWIDNHVVKMIGDPIEVAEQYCKALGVPTDLAALNKATL